MLTISPPPFYISFLPPPLRSLARSARRPQCKHSYHARCLGEAENECPSCARAYGVVRDIRKNNQEMASRHEL